MSDALPGQRFDSSREETCACCTNVREELTKAGVYASDTSVPVFTLVRDALRMGRAPREPEYIDMSANASEKLCSCSCDACDEPPFEHGCGGPECNGPKQWHAQRRMSKATPVEPEKDSVRLGVEVDGLNIVVASQMEDINRLYAENTELRKQRDEWRQRCTNLLDLRLAAEEPSALACGHEASNRLQSRNPDSRATCALHDEIATLRQGIHDAYVVITTAGSPSTDEEGWIKKATAWREEWG